MHTQSCTYSWKLSTCTLQAHKAEHSKLHTQNCTLQAHKAEHSAQHTPNTRCRMHFSYYNQSRRSYYNPSTYHTVHYVQSPSMLSKLFCRNCDTVHFYRENAAGFNKVTSLYIRFLLETPLVWIFNDFWTEAVWFISPNIFRFAHIGHTYPCTRIDCSGRNGQLQWNTSSTPLTKCNKCTFSDQGWSLIKHIFCIVAPVH